MGQGAVINISSVLALAPERYDGIYSGSKSFLLNLSQSMTAHYSSQGLYMQAVLPGATRTELWERSGKDINSFPIDADGGGGSCGRCACRLRPPRACDHSSASRRRTLDRHAGRSSFHGSDPFAARSGRPLPILTAIERN
nr:SDR family NAD(P)-dependent oxidoreductase [Rhizobium sp. SG741]